MQRHESEPSSAATAAFEGSGEIDVLRAAELCAGGDALVLDVREPDEWAVAHVPGAVHIPLRELAARVEELETKRRILAICLFGGRSNKAARELRRAGFTVANVRGGMEAWQEAGLPVESGDGSRTGTPPTDVHSSLASSSGELVELEADLCKALGDPKRLLLVGALRAGPRTVSDLSADLGLTQSNVSQHLAVLRRRDVVRARRFGSYSFYSLSSPKVLQALDTLSEFLAEQVGERGLPTR